MRCGCISRRARVGRRLKGGSQLGRPTHRPQSGHDEAGQCAHQRRRRPEVRPIPQGQWHQRHPQDQNAARGAAQGSPGTENINLLATSGKIIKI